MKPFRSGAAGLCVACGLLFATVGHAADAPLPAKLGSVERAKAGRASELLDAAVAYLRHNGPEAAFQAFNDPKGSFVYGPYYVFVVDADGLMRANGGTQMSLAGVNALDLRDAAGKPVIRDLLAAAQQKPTGSVEYRWLNPEDHRIEVKVSLYAKVDSHVVSVGYYTPRATRQEAQVLLDRAVDFLKQTSPEQAFAAFNNPQGGFMQEDQYVFVVGLDDGRYRASGASPHLNGMDVRGMKDAAGTPLFENMIALARKAGSGTVEYVWRNPATNAVETKHTLIQRVDDVLLGVGYYTR
jgi:cytochrome c